ncbi:hypothetical protein KC363_g58 [Hortaea werneckii]|nr:hypothetical protein KC363_g58 [Hortaea werneckii]
MCSLASAIGIGSPNGTGLETKYPISSSKSIFCVGPNVIRFRAHQIGKGPARLTFWQCSKLVSTRHSAGTLPAFNSSCNCCLTALRVGHGSAAKLFKAGSEKICASMKLCPDSRSKNRPGLAYAARSIAWLPMATTQRGWREYVISPFEENRFDCREIEANGGAAIQGNTKIVLRTAYRHEERESAITRFRAGVGCRSIFDVHMCYCWRNHLHFGHGARQ